MSVPATEHSAVQAAFAKKPRLIPKNLEILEVGSQAVRVLEIGEMKQQTILIFYNIFHRTVYSSYSEKRACNPHF